MIFPSYGLYSVYNGLTSAGEIYVGDFVEMYALSKLNCIFCIWERHLNLTNDNSRE